MVLNGGTRCEPRVILAGCNRKVASRWDSVGRLKVPGGVDRREDTAAGRSGGWVADRQISQGVIRMHVDMMDYVRRGDGGMDPLKTGELIKGWA